jgi:adenylate cyclase
VDVAGVARLHAVLVRKANRGVYLVDLGTREGTYLNGEPVSEEVLLMDGDRISLGNAVTFEFLDGARPKESKVRRWAKRVWSTAAGHPLLP